jgi:two-component system KDP operon response regulator KdpE
VLIVDDERSIRLSLRTILSGLGYVIVEAARGQEALSLTRTAQFDVVLLDINMPGMGGIDVCRMMRRNSSRLPIVMLTVQGGEDRKVEALDAGADDYITKPFQLRELIARLRAVVRRNKNFETPCAEKWTHSPLNAKAVRASSFPNDQRGQTSASCQAAAIGLGAGVRK